MSKTTVTTTPLNVRIAAVKCISDLLPLISEAGRLQDSSEAHRLADAIMARLARFLAAGHPDEATAIEIARRWGTIDRK